MDGGALDCNNLNSLSRRYERANPYRASTVEQPEYVTRALMEFLQT
jgi:hypothetical protein